MRAGRVLQTVRHGILLTALAATVFSAEAIAANADAREAFKAVYADVELGDWTAVEALDPETRQALRDYVLWPDLRSAWLRANLSTIESAEVDAFLEAHGSMRPARDLRYRYALTLGRAGQHREYLELYEAYFQGLDVARLDCLALSAEIASERTYRVANRALALWMTAESQADECDPVFDWLTTEGHLTRAHYLERFELTIEAREFARARWLAKSLDDAFVEEAEAWQSAASNPADFVRGQRHRAETDNERQRLLYALERLTYRDPLEAAELWAKARHAHPFTEAERIRISRHIALWTARDGLPDAYALLKALPVAAQSTEVARWRARVSLREGEWPRLIGDIASMSPDESGLEEWQYWLAIAHERAGEPTAARALLTELADERSYYGFLAADALGETYAFADAELEADDTALAELSMNPALVRARELFLVGLDSRGRSEWDAATRRLSVHEQRQAAILAHRWGWHSRAIATAARVEQFDDLSIRYPLPYRDAFRNAAGAVSIPTTWAYGVARSESLFMRDVRSSAGAVGLMQLMPATGRAVAQALDIRFDGVKTLTDPAVNIQLGTSYLAQMTDRFQGNRVLATAAYNAGPHRVDNWLPDSAPVDTRIWIENIPFNETRKYVRRVLAAETIFHWRMTGQARRLSDVLSAVMPPPPEESVARLGTAERHLGQ